MTLAIFGQWQSFGSERGFYRYTQRHLRAAFPQLPTREQFNRQMRQHHEALGAFFCTLCSSWRPNAAPMKPSTAPGSRPGMPSGGELGWLPGLADIGWSNRLGVV